MFIRYFKTLSALLLAMSALTMSACTGNVSTASATGEPYDADAAAAAVAEAPGEAADSKTTDVKEPEEHKLSFATADEAIEWMRNTPDADKYMAGILPDMARDQLDYCVKLLNSKYPRFIIADKATMHVYLYDKYGCEIERYGMACARNFGTKHRRGDNRTPDGFFTAEGIYNSTDWLYTNDAGYTSPAKGVYGPKFIRVNVPNTRSIGLHGTNAPGSIGRRASHGCMRLRNEDIKKLAAKAQVGMPIIISPGPKDIAVNEREHHPVPSVAVVPGVPRAKKGNAPYMSPAKPKKKHDKTPADSVSPGASSAPAAPVAPEQPTPPPAETPAAPEVPASPATPAE